MISTFPIVVFIVVVIANQPQFCWALFCLRRDPGLTIGISRGNCPIKLNQYGGYQCRHGVFRSYFDSSYHIVSSPLKAASSNPSISELSTSIAKLQGQLNELSHILQSVVTQENDGGKKSLPTNQETIARGVIAKGGNPKIAGTVQAAPLGVDLVR